MIDCLIAPLSNNNQAAQKQASQCNADSNNLKKFVYLIGRFFIIFTLKHIIGHFSCTPFCAENFELKVK
jgi:hypothetical protein